jgi:formiminoglutamase
MLEERGQQLAYLCLGVSETANTRALFERADAWGVDYVLDRDMRPHLLDQVKAKIDQFLSRCDVLYLTIDLDVLPHWQMPAVSAPAAYGVGIDVIEDIITHLAHAGIDWPLTDVVELNPKLERDGTGARVAARLCDHAVRTAIP